MPTVRELIAGSQYFSPEVRPSAEVSILLPTFRRGRSGLFKTCVDSLLAQTYSNFELIIVDDHSIDGTFDQIVAYMKADPRISCIRHDRNIGLPAVSEFEAYQRSRGELLWFAFDDNEFYPDALQQLVTELRQRNAAMVYGDVDAHFFGTDGADLVLRNFGFSDAYIGILESNNFIGNNAVLLRREIIEDVGLYDPHIVLPRSCDWDLWRRISARYLIHAVPVAVGREYGPKLADNLAASYEMDPWVVNEWIKRPNRNQQLLPRYFEDYDVCQVPENSTLCFRTSVARVRKQFANPLIRNGESFKEAGRLLVVSSGITASTTLCFNSLPSAYEDIRIIESSAWSPREVATARAAIFSRQGFVFGNSNWLRYCKAAGVPHYFFLDDNFIVLGKEGYRDLRPWSNLDNVRKALKSFSGVLLSSSELVDYFRSNTLHDNLLLFPPIRQAIEYSGPRRPRAPGVFRVGFLGGHHRYGTLVACVVPAIVAARKQFDIEIVAGGIPEHELQAALEGHDIPSIALPFEYTYQAAMMRMMAEDIDLLVHPGEPIENNRYKTTNVLLNADILGIPALVSNTRPYSDVVSLDVCVTVDNDLEAWQTAIVELRNNPERRKEIVNANRRYCRTGYDGSRNEKVLSHIIESHPFGPELRGRRSQKLSDFIANDITNSIKLKQSLRNSWDLAWLIARNRFREHILEGRPFRTQKDK